MRIPLLIMLLLFQGIGGKGGDGGKGGHGGGVPPASAPTYVNSADSPQVGSCAVSFTAGAIGHTLYAFYMTPDGPATGVPTDTLSETWAPTPLGAQTASGQFFQVWHTVVTATSANTITFQTTANHGQCAVAEYTATTFDNELLTPNLGFSFASSGPIAITAATDICIGFGLLQGTDATTSAPFTIRRLIGGSGSGYFLMDGTVTSACTIATTNAAVPTVMWGITSK